MSTFPLNGDLIRQTAPVAARHLLVWVQVLLEWVKMDHLVNSGTARRIIGMSASAFVAFALVQSAVAAPVDRQMVHVVSVDRVEHVATHNTGSLTQRAATFATAIRHAETLAELQILYRQAYALRSEIKSQDPHRMAVIDTAFYETERRLVQDHRLGGAPRFVDASDTMQPMRTSGY